MGRNSRKLGTWEQLWKLLDQLGKRKFIFLCIESTYMIYHNKCLKAYVSNKHADVDKSVSLKLGRKHLVPQTWKWNGLDLDRMIQGVYWRYHAAVS